MHHNTRLRGAALTVVASLATTLLVAGPAQAVGKPTRIKGTVVSTSGAGLAGIVVTTLADPTGTGEWVAVDDAVTGVDGKYNVGKLDDGWYRVRFDDPTGAYTGEFYDDAARIEDATPVDLTLGGMPTLAIAELEAATHLAGTVTGADGAGIAGAEVTTYVMQAGAWAPFRSLVAGPDGAYDFAALPTGDYTLGFRDPVSGVTEYWDDQESIADATAVAVPGDQRYDAQLATPVPDPTTPDPTTPVPTTPDPTTPAPTGTTPLAAVPTATVPAAAVLTVLSKPRVKGRAEVGRRLRVTLGTWSLASVTTKVQWLANGKVLEHATKKRMRLTSKLRGKRISVRVVASAPGATPVTVTTARTRKIAG